MKKSQSSSWGKSSKWYGRLVGDRGHYYHQRVVLPAVLSALAIKPADRVLDLACGQGVFSRQLDSNVEYLGVDISGALIKQAKELNQSNKHQFIVGDITKDLPITKDHYTKAVIILALQNIKQPKLAIAQAGKALVRGGELVILINHPCFRIPRQSGWDTPNQGLQKRWISRYLSFMEIPITTHPSIKTSTVTLSYHQPLSAYVKDLHEAQMVISDLTELVSDKQSQGKAAQAENRSRAEIPLFMLIKAVKQG